MEKGRGFSVLHADGFWRIDLDGESVFDSDFAAWCEEFPAQIHRLGRDHLDDIFAVDSRKCRRMAIQLSLRNHTFAVDLFNFVGNKSEENHRARMDYLHFFIYHQSLRDLSFFMDGLCKTVKF